VITIPSIPPTIPSRSHRRELEHHPAGAFHPAGALSWYRQKTNERQTTCIQKRSCTDANRKSLTPTSNACSLRSKELPGMDHNYRRPDASLSDWETRLEWKRCSWDKLKPPWTLQYPHWCHARYSYFCSLLLQNYPHQHRSHTSAHPHRPQPRQRRLHRPPSLQLHPHRLRPILHWHLLLYRPANI